jgi:hypothetical protein
MGTLLNKSLSRLLLFRERTRLRLAVADPFLRQNRNIQRSLSNLIELSYTESERYLIDLRRIQWKTQR